MDLLTLDIDLRMAEVWECIMEFGFEEDEMAAVASFCRASYAKGYGDAHSERDPGKLYFDNGYNLPRKEVT